MSREGPSVPHESRGCVRSSIAFRSGTDGKSCCKPELFPTRWTKLRVSPEFAGSLFRLRACLFAGEAE